MPVKKGWKTGLKVTALALLLVGVLGSAALSAMTLSKTMGIEERFAQEEREALEEEQPREDGVKIAENYEIRSTLPISDAYRSGDSSSLDEKQKETLDMAKAVLDEIITEDMSDYEKEKAVYDWMTSSLQNDSGLLTVIPSTQADCDNPYGVLKYHNAVCVGYATTFRLFMQMLGIDCKVVHNTDRYHSWDLVKLDGDWYHVDIYSDAGQGGYANFNLSDQIRGRENDWDRSFFPAANGYKYNEGYQNRQKVADIFAIPEKLRSALEEKSGILYLEFEETIDEERAQVGEQILNQCNERMYNIPDQSAYLSWFWIQDPDSQKFLLATTISRDQSSNVELDEETEEKIQQAVGEAFDDLVGEDGGDGGDAVPYNAPEWFREGVAGGRSVTYYG